MFGGIKLYAILAVVVLVLGGQIFVAYELISGERAKTRAVAAEGAVATIEKTGKAVESAKETLAAQPIDGALAKQGWCRDCSQGQVRTAEPPAAPPAVVVNPTWETVVKPAKKKHRKHKVKTWVCQFIAFCDGKFVVAGAG